MPLYRIVMQVIRHSECTILVNAPTEATARRKIKRGLVNKQINYARWKPVGGDQYRIISFHEYESESEGSESDDTRRGNADDPRAEAHSSDPAK